VLPDYPDGVWLVELAALADPALVPQAVAAAVGVREEPGRPLATTLAAALAPKRLLLVLDNCEHLLDACARPASPWRWRPTTTARGSGSSSGAPRRSAPPGP
jgi:predicted ATPase